MGKNEGETTFKVKEPGSISYFCGFGHNLADGVVMWNGF